ncbi:aldo/keto reductase [Frateuria aurantia]
MQYVRLGSTGLKVSPLALGCMTYGEPERGDHPWTLPEPASRALLKQALELGFNFFDTANRYSNGSSEEIVGAALRDFARRDEVVLATKVFFPMGEGPNAGGLSRKSILSAIDASLRRLGTDYVDLYQIHRWDYETPIEETMEALHDLVRSGKVRYLGASSMYAWQFAKAQHCAERNGWTRFVSMQNHVNLLYREEEREMLPLCMDQQVGVLPWSPLARGRLARPWAAGSAREQSDQYGQTLYGAGEAVDRAIIEAVGAIAEAHGVSRAAVALAWLLQKPEVSAPIIGVSKEAHFQDALSALALQLAPEDIEALETPYRSQPVSGIQ